MVNLIFLPLFTEILIITAASIILTYIIFIFFRKKISHEKLSENHTVASYIFNAFSLSYCVLLAFIVYENWFNYDRAQQNVFHETSYISNLYRDTRILPDSLKTRVTEKLINYTKAVINDEWIKFAEGNTSTVTDSAIGDLYKTYISIPVSQIPNPYLYQVSLDKLNFVSQYRRMRILDMEQTVPSVVWSVLIICFIVSVGYAYFFATKGKKVHMFLIATYVIVNILIFYLIYVLDHPYKGYACISSDPYQILLNKFLTGN
jgi:hypothetical protein